MADKIPKRVPEYIDLDVFECLTSELIMYPLSIIYALENYAVNLGSHKQTINNVQELTFHLVGSRCYTEMLGKKVQPSSIFYTGLWTLMER